MAERRTYQVHLDNFDGPLDLLLHLIDKNKMDIYDIPIADITAQYLAFLEEAREMDLEIASEFLLTAATLLEIKARMLLPRRAAEEAPETDPRAELVRRLVEYRFYKETAQMLRAREQKAPAYMLKPQNVERLTRDLAPGNPLENVTPEALWEAFAQVMEHAAAEAPRAIALERETYSVEDCMEEVRGRLRAAGTGGVPFAALFPRGSSKRRIITLFLALLELCRLGELTFRQQNNFDPLWIYPREMRSEVD